MSKPQAIVIGAGFTGVATAHDLALRGFDVSVVDRGPVANGTSGRTHGLVHSGGRYCVKDREAGTECIEENLILRAIVPQVIEGNEGLFVALSEEDLAYGEEFVEGAEDCGIAVDYLSAEDTLRLEPNLNPNLLASFRVPDATFDPLRLALAFAATAKGNGARFHLYSEVIEFLLDGKGNVTGVKVWDRKDGSHFELSGDVVINATGAWSGLLAKMANAEVPISPSPGIMVAFDQRLVNRTINHLTKPSDGDIILPQRRMLVVGTTSYEVDDPDYIPVMPEQIQKMVDKGSALIPGLRNAKQRGAYTAARPLVGAGGGGRSLSWTFKCFDHKETDNIDGFVTITGGKATTLRAMAEKTADIVCEKLGVTSECRTKEVPLRSYRDFYRDFSQIKTRQMSH
ncbi:MAG: FAD-dependent oxidoreductase [Anaerolineales bacterium]|nr:FAD-dependent oxidoreductase [Anaerolineales bacterium]